MNEFKIFLSGSIQKQFKELNTGKSYWEADDEDYLKNNLIFPIKILNPNTISIDKNNAEGRFNEDLIMLLESDLVITDVKDKKGIGIGSEMILAKIYKIPVYSICPPNSHYRKKISDNQEWIHPFIYELSDKIFDSKNALVFYLNELFKIGKIQNKPQIDILDAIDRLNGFDAGYDEGYMAVKNFWGDKPASFVQLATKLIKKQNIDNVLCLDLGCGNGKNSIYLAENGFNVTALDASYYCISEAKKVNKDVKWKVRDMRKLKCENNKYDLIVLTGSLHCLSTLSEVLDVVETAKLSTKVGGYNVISVFNNDFQDLSGHSVGFHPILLSHDEYMNMYSDWEVIESCNTILEDKHPHNNINHKHSITRMLVQRMR